VYVVDATMAKFANHTFAHLTMRHVVTRRVRVADAHVEASRRHG